MTDKSFKKYLRFLSSCFSLFSQSWRSSKSSRGYSRRNINITIFHMIRALAQWAAKKYYLFNQEYQAAIADLHAGLSLKLAGEKRALIDTLQREADAIEANIESVDEKLAAGYWECENGHEKTDAFLPEVTGTAEARTCLDCKAPAKYVRRDQMTGQEQYESDKERKEAEQIAACERQGRGGERRRQRADREILQGSGKEQPDDCREGTRTIIPIPNKRSR
jgi:hypothetical protein